MTDFCASDRSAPPPAQTFWQRKQCGHGAPDESTVPGASARSRAAPASDVLRYSYVVATVNRPIVPCGFVCIHMQLSALTII